VIGPFDALSALQGAFRAERATPDFPEKLTPALPNQPDTPVLGETGVNFSGIATRVSGN
jgi:hypothetical protein